MIRSIFSLLNIYFLTAYVAFAGTAYVTTMPAWQMDSAGKKVVIIGKGQTVTFECIASAETGTVLSDGYSWTITGGAYSINGDQTSNSITVTFMEEAKTYSCKVGLTHHDFSDEENPYCWASGQELKGTEILVKVAKVEVEEVSFFGEGNYPIKDITDTYENTSGDNILWPEWKKGETNQKSVLYKKGTKPELSAKYKITPDLLNLEKSIKIKAAGTGSYTTLIIESRACHELF